jgi:hypothetical protein
MWNNPLFPLWWRSENCPDLVKYADGGKYSSSFLAFSQSIIGEGIAVIRYLLERG